MISLDQRELKQFQTDLKIKRPSQVNAIIRETLNDQAKASRIAAREKTIPKMFNNRSKWVAGSILVDFADKKQKDPKKLVAYNGAKKRWGANKTKDFDGLRIQEFGDSRKDPAIETTSARISSSWGRNVNAKSRALNSAQLPDETSYPGVGRNRVIVMLRAMERQGNLAGFRISKNYQGFKKGVYRFGTKKIKLASGKKVRTIQQTLDLSRKRIKTPKRQWLKQANKIGVTSSTTTKSFVKNYKKYTSPRKQTTK